MVDIAELFNFEQFLYSYIIFLFFFIFIIGLAGADFSLYFTDLSESTFLNLNTSLPLSPEEPDSNASWLSGFLFNAEYFLYNIRFFFTMMTIDTGVLWLGLLVFTPAFIFVMWGVLKHLIRG